MNFTDKLLDALKNVYFRPTKTRVEINDKATKNYFNLSAKDYDALINRHKKINIIEKRNHKKYGTIKTPTSISNVEGYSNVNPLTEFDRAVLSVLISEQLAGNKYTTPAIIYRALVGKVGENIAPSKNQIAAILASVEKLMFTKFDADTAKSFEQLKYPKGDEIRLRKSTMLPACLVDAKINGQIIKDVIYFDREAPLYLIADAKNQIIRYDSNLLDVPNMNNTPLIITIKNYVIRRICEIKLHKQLAPTLTFDDIFQKCRIDNASPKVKFDARNIISKFLEHLKAQNFIDSFDIIKSKHGKKFHSITFTFTPADENIDDENISASQNSEHKPQKPNYSNSVTNYSNSGILPFSKYKKKARRHAACTA